MKIFIAGNHDNALQDLGLSGTCGDSCYYLCDSGTEFEYTEPVRNLFDSEDNSLVYRKKLKIWGSPWTLTFDGMNPRCKAFTVDTEKELAEKWAMIPDDIDILVTHSPPYGWQDTALDGRRVGSYTLTTHLSRIVPKLHIFGHVIYHNLKFMYSGIFTNHMDVWIQIL
jgi:hypothetical protein